MKLFILFLLSTTSFASNQLAFKKSFFRVAGTTALWKYVEPDVMKEYGPFFGGELLYHYHNETNGSEMDFRTSFIFSNETKYDGSLFDGTPYKFIDKNRIFYIRANYYPKENRKRLRIIYGFQFRRLVNPNVAATTADYRREQDYLTMNLGARVLLFNNLKSHMNLDFNLHTLLHGQNRSFINGSNSEPFKFKQSFGKGFGFETNLDYYIGHLFLGLNFTYWNIANSSTVPISNRPGYVLLEPKNYTLHGNFHLGVRF